MVLKSTLLPWKRSGNFIVSILWGNSCDLQSYNCLQLHIRSALRLREMCSRNGGLFVKVGQHVGSLDYLLPSEYVNTFKIFHSEAPQTPLHRMKKVIEEEMKRPGEWASVIVIQWNLSIPDTTGTV